MTDHNRMAGPPERTGLAFSSLLGARWVLARLVRRPLVLLWLTAVVLAWPLVQALSPLGITTASLDPSGPVRELAFLSLLVGCALALGALAEGDWILDQAPRGRRLGAATAGLVCGGLVFAAAGLALPLAWAAWIGRSEGGSLAALSRSAAAPLGGLLVGAGLSLLHLTALGLLLLRAPVPARWRATLLPLAAWIVPAALGEGAVGRVARALLDASRHATLTLGPGSPTALAGALAPIMGGFLAAALLDRPGRGST